MKKIITCVISSLVLFTVLGGILAYRNEWFYSPQKYDENNIGECYFQETKEEHIVTNDSCMYADNEILVVAKENVKKSQIEKLAKKYDANIVGWIEQTGDYQWEMNSIYSIDELESIVSDLKNENVIDSASINYISEISESGLPVNYGKEWSGETWDENDHAGSNWGLEAIHALSAWDVLEEHEEKVNPIRLGLIDSGFDTNHEDLEDCFVDTFYNTSPNDHGTHVAGIMAANSDNNEGICGVYPYGKGNLYGASWSSAGSIKENISIMKEKCCYSELILRNVKVINCSYGNDINLIHLNNAQKYIDEQAEELENFFLRILGKGYDFVIIQASGNNSNKYYTKLKVGSDGGVILDKAGKATYDANGEYTEIYYQNGGLAVKGWYYQKDKESKCKKINGLNTSKDNENVYNSGWADCNYVNETILFKNENLKNRVIVVGSIGIETNYSEALFDQKTNIYRGDSGYHISNFSNLGERVDIFAPGENIFSTVINGYDKKKGTSMASPHVAGIATMVWAANNNLTGAEVKEIICSTANNLISQPGSSYYKTDYKLVDAKSAVEKALGIEKEETTNPQNGGILCWVVDKDNEDEKIEGATVTATNIDTGVPESTKTDSNGHFELFLPEGNYTLTVTANETANEYDDYTYNGTIEVKNNGVNYLDDWIKMKRSKGSISGTITDESGNPIKNAEVTATVTLSDTLANKTVKTDSKGYFKIECNTGNYKIKVTADGYEEYKSDEVINVEKDFDTILDTIQLRKEHSYIDLSQYIGTNIDEFVKGNGSMYRQGTSEIEYTDGDFWIASDSDLLIDAVGIQENCEYSIYGIYYGMSIEEAVEIAYSIFSELYENLPYYKSFHIGNKATLSFHAEDEKTVDGVYLHYYLIRNSSEIVSTEPSTQLETTIEWQSAYIKVLCNLINNSSAKFITAYIDEDDIPELIVAYDSSHVAGCDIYTYYDGNISKLEPTNGEFEFGSSGEILYLPHKNLFDSRYYGMGSNSDSLYRINNGKAQLECNLQYNDYFTTVRVIEFKIDGIEKSENEYWDKYNSYEIDSMVSANYDDMIEINYTNISNYFN